MGADLTLNRPESNQAFSRSKSNINLTSTEKNLCSNLNYSKSSSELENLIEPVYKPTSLEPILENIPALSKVDLINTKENRNNLESDLKENGDKTLQTKADYKCTLSHTQEENSSPKQFYIVTDGPLTTDGSIDQLKLKSEIINQGYMQISPPENALETKVRKDNILDLNLSIHQGTRTSNSVTFPTENIKISNPSVQALNHQLSTNLPCVPSGKWIPKTLGPSLASRAARWTNQPSAQTQEITRTYSESLLVNQILGQFNCVQGLASVYSRPPPKKRKKPGILMVNKPIIHFKRGMPINTGAVLEIAKVFK